LISNFSHNLSLKIHVSALKDAMFDKVITLPRLNARFLRMHRKDVCETQPERRSEIVNWYNRKENRNRSSHEILTRTVGIP